MKKAGKTYGVKYGIIITKPWSNEMYDHNETVAEIMKDNIKNILFELWKLTKDETRLLKVSKHICYYGFGDGYSAEDVYEETRKDLEQMQNYQLHEVYDELEKDGFVTKLDEFLIGYDN